MTAVLVVDDDPQLRSAVVRDLSEQGFTVRQAASVAEAVDVLSSEAVDVLLTDLRMGNEDGIDLLQRVRLVAGHVRPILMSAFATASDHQTATSLGAVRVLCKPFTSDELTMAIRQAADCSTGFHGSVHGLSLVDLLQMFHFGRRTVCIRLGGAAPGQIHIRDGEIIHATLGERAGEAALSSLLARPWGSIETTALVDGPRTIERSFQSLLLDLVRQLDEADSQDTDDVDAAFDGLAEVSASLPPAAELEHPSFDAIRVTLARFAPDARAVRVGSAPEETYTVFGPPQESPALLQLLSDLAQRVDRLDPTWCNFEIESETMGLCLLRRANERAFVAISDLLLGRHAVTRFRALSTRVATTYLQHTSE